MEYLVEPKIVVGGEDWCICETLGCANCDCRIHVPCSFCASDSCNPKGVPCMFALVKQP